MSEERPVVVPLRSESGKLLGVLNCELERVAIKRGNRLYEIDLRATLEQRRPIIFERVLGEPETRGE